MHVEREEGSAGSERRGEKERYREGEKEIERERERDREREGEGEKTRYREREREREREPKSRERQRSPCRIREFAKGGWQKSSKENGQKQKKQQKRQKKVTKNENSDRPCFENKNSHRRRFVDLMSLRYHEIRQRSWPGPFSEYPTPPPRPRLCPQELIHSRQSKARQRTLPAEALTVFFFLAVLDIIQDHYGAQKGEDFSLTVGVFLLTVELLCLQSLKAFC